MKDKLTANWQIKIVCFLLAVLIYFVAEFAVLDTRTITLPLTVILPSDYQATSIIPQSVDVEIKGTEDQIYMLDPDNLSVVADFSKVSKEGVSSVKINVDTSYYDGVLDLTKVTITSEPQSIRVYFEK